MTDSTPDRLGQAVSDTLSGLRVDETAPFLVRTGDSVRKIADAPGGLEGGTARHFRRTKPPVSPVCQRSKAVPTRDVRRPTDPDRGPFRYGFHYFLPRY